MYPGSYYEERGQRLIPAYSQRFAAIAAAITAAAAVRSYLARFRHVAWQNDYDADDGDSNGNMSEIELRYAG